MQSTQEFTGENFSPSWGFPTYQQGYFQWSWGTAEGPYGHTLTMHYYAQPVPEPGTIVLAGIGGLFILAVAARRRRRE